MAILGQLVTDAGAPQCDESYRGLCTWLDAHDPSGVLARLLQYVVVPIVVLVLLILLGRLVRRLVDGAMHDWGGDPQIRTLVHNVITAVAWVLAIFGAAVKAGLSISVLLTFGGVATLAIGLAFQDLLRNVLAGIFLLVERPFRLGDWVTIGDQSGSVETISLRTTCLRTGDGRLAVLPNLSAFNGTVLNSNAYDVRRYTVSVRVPDVESLDALMRRCRHMLRRLPEVEKEPGPTVIPRLDLEWTLLDCSYSLRYREHDPDALHAAVAQKLYALVHGSAAETADDDEDEPEEPAPPVAEEELEERPSALQEVLRPLRRRAGRGG